jgi:hypothetical protein
MGLSAGFTTFWTPPSTGLDPVLAHRLS